MCTVITVLFIIVKNWKQQVILNRSTENIILRKKLNASEGHGRKQNLNKFETFHSLYCVSLGLP